MQSAFFDPKEINRGIKVVKMKKRYHIWNEEMKIFWKNLTDFLQLAISNPKYYMKSRKRWQEKYYTQMIVIDEATDF